jgi:hypothetical protein
VVCCSITRIPLVNSAVRVALLRSRYTAFRGTSLIPSSAGFVQLDLRVLPSQPQKAPSPPKRRRRCFCSAGWSSSHVPTPVVQRREKAIANFQRGMSMGGHIDAVQILSVQMSCDLATLFCRYEATNSGQKAIGRKLVLHPLLR